MSKSQITGNKCMYYVCYKMSLMGWNVMPTARNALGIDVVAYPELADCFLGIQTKGLSKRNPVPLGNNLDKVMGDCWIIVNDLSKEIHNCFVMEPRVVKNLAHRSVNKKGEISYWLQPKSYDTKQYRDNWDLLDNLVEGKRSHTHV